MSKEKKKEKEKDKEKKNKKKDQKVEKKKETIPKVEVHFIEEGVAVDVKEGSLLKKAFKKAEIKKKYPCDKGKCGKCKVLVKKSGSEEWEKSLPCVDEVKVSLEVKPYKKN